VGYIRKNFLCGRTADSLEDLRRQAAAWCAEVANVRVHGTTHMVVKEAWDQEKPHLQPLDGRAPFVYVPEEVRRVTLDAFVHFAASRYSVPWRLAGKEVTVLVRDGLLEVWRGGQKVAVHALSERRHQAIIAPGHHDDIPLGGSGRKGKAMIHVIAGAPSVEVRSLSVYEALSGGDR
jgi:hypothetical protein